MPDLTQAQGDAIQRARRAMYAQLAREFPDRGVQLFAVACVGGVCDVLNHPQLGPAVVPLIEEQLIGTPYQLGKRAAN